MTTADFAADVLEVLRRRDGQGPDPWLDAEARDELIQGALDAYDRVAVSAVSKKRKRAGFALAAGAIVFVASAAGAMLVISRMAAEDLPAANLVEVSGRGAAAADRAPLNEQAIEEATIPEVNAERPAAPRHQPASGVEPQLTQEPADLLQKASKLRRSGDSAEAARVYRQVVSRHPGTLSAYVALVSLAGMRAGSSPAEALRLYQQAQAAQPSGSLDVEIRMGMARVYRQQGNTQQEIEQLKVVSHRYPDSALGKAAEKRLESLTRSTR